MASQRILNPKDFQTFKGRRSQKKKGFHKSGKWRCASLKIQWENNELEFQKSH